METKKLIEKSIKDLLKKYNFKKKWVYRYYYNNNFIFYLNLQKSQRSNLFYLNIAIYFKKYTTEIFPKRYSHIDFRFESLIQNNEENTKYKISLDYNDNFINIEQKISTITDFIEKYFIKFIKETNNLEDLKKNIFEKKNVGISKIGQSELWLNK